jgi:hypothetical protein
VPHRARGLHQWSRLGRRGSGVRNQRHSARRSSSVMCRQDTCAARAPGCQRRARPHRRLRRTLQLGVEKGDIKARVMRYQRRIADERWELVGHVIEQRLVGEEFGSKPVHRDGVGRYVALRT